MDPACGSGIFLVLAFKRLVRWWRAKHNFNKPRLDELKQLLHGSIFGVDKNKSATFLTSFSLCIALCDELTPKQIWNDLKFDDLTQKNIFNNDFFEWIKTNNELFDVIIGNPPFKRGGTKDDKWYITPKITVKIPQNQIALKFLSDSLSIMKKNARLCLIIKASSLLYNSTSAEYKKALFENFNVNQIFDFSPLARNKAMWDCKTDVAAAAIFITKEAPDFSKNVLHAIFRRTKTNKERIFFEIDEYDLHFILRKEAYQNPYIYKINLMGGGRLKQLIDRCREYKQLGDFLIENNCNCNEGFQIGYGGKLLKSYLYEYQYLPTDAFGDDDIDFSQLEFLPKDTNFAKIPQKETFECPNLIIKENIGHTEIPVFFNKEKNFSFKHKLLGIYSQRKETAPLILIHEFFKKYSKIYRCFCFATSSQLLINLNTSILKADILHLPVFDSLFELTDIEQNLIDDVNLYLQDFHRHGEQSTILQRVEDDFIKSYGHQFTKTLNHLYANNHNSFKLTHIFSISDQNFYGVLFSYNNN
ncbi:MAG: N-6 DNA methylase, partial [Ignavibacteriales bacterium]|nr:N-6 DNA methylase [Ignavibacteriales bacterium]